MNVTPDASRTLGPSVGEDPEPGGNEVVEVAVTRDEGHVVVEAALRDQRVRKLGPVARANDLGTESGRALPVARPEVEGGNPKEGLLERPRQLGARLTVPRRRRKPS